MNRLIAHRGRDDEGFALFTAEQAKPFFGDDSASNLNEAHLPFLPKQHISAADGNCEIALAHRRLSILDLSPTGHQPMSTSDQKIWITYNGEIYNYLEIKEELKQKGHSFFSNSDTEVILKAYQEWGTRCVQRFNGMWAFALYDSQKSLLWCSRDRIGVKPFYYCHDDHKFLFASEQKALLHSGLIPKKINAQAAFDYLSFNEIENHPQGILQGIIELAPAHHLLVDTRSGKMTIEKYYTLEVNNSTEKVDPIKSAKYIEQISEHLQASVKLRLRADVEIGSCLSGGLDSSSIVGLMHHLQPNKKIHLFTATSSDKAIDESQWAKKMVDFTNGQWHTTQATSEELLRDLEELTTCQDIPLFSTSTYAQWRVMQQVKEVGIKVVLDGQGGDEIFAGYEPHRYFLNNETHKNWNKAWLKHHGLKKLPAAVLQKMYRTKFADFNTINNELFQRCAPNTFAEFKNNQQFSLNERLAYEYENSSLKSYLKCEDRCSMWFSVESRVPLADDHALSKLLFSIPGAYKIQNTSLKFLLQSAVTGYVPDEVRLRKDKLGYVTPNNQWIYNIKNEVKDYFSADLSEYIDVAKLLKDYDKFFDQRQSPENRRLFKFISFAIWKKVNALH